VLDGAGQGCRRGDRPSSPCSCHACLGLGILLALASRRGAAPLSARLTP
jgi:hypothetical protein